MFSIFVEPLVWESRPSWWRNFITRYTEELEKQEIDYDWLSQAEQNRMLDDFFLDHNIKTVRTDGYFGIITSLLFEAEEDATMFILRWS
jgi:hypothetical protein